MASINEADRQIINDLEAAGERLGKARAAIGRVIFGQDEVVEQVLIAILGGGHALLVGAPGLAKTKLATTLGRVLGLDEKRVQFTPDLMPADILGSEVLDEAEGGGRQFRFLQGPVFCQLMMADEINRASPRTQSALLQAMQEHHVTVAGQRHDLPRPFHVLATQNPIEQEGTYPLPEAQLDRFLMHVRIDYPDGAAEAAILTFARERARECLVETRAPQRLLSQQQIFAARTQVLGLHLAPALEEYVVQLVLATRTPKAYGTDLARWIAYGASPRGTIALDRCARAHAWLAGRDFVAPEDVHAVAIDVLRHRVLLSYEAEAEGVTPERVISALLDRVPLP